jgi:hypothetical protein
MTGLMTERANDRLIDNDANIAPMLDVSPARFETRNFRRHLY